jgi:hypothetical protein
MAEIENLGLTEDQSDSVHDMPEATRAARRQQFLGQWQWPVAFWTVLTSCHRGADAHCERATKLADPAANLCNHILGSRIQRLPPLSQLPEVIELRLNSSNAS